ncbi:MAG: bacillithiol system redox-active protein YtxJ [Chitinophagaceae bacterium]|nr:bacillithiol system redox-active protein YtxJ [Chitinophagaceae bacterium]
MNWHILTIEDQWNTLLETSQTRPQLVYKHSTRCSISSVVKGRLERAGAPDDVDFHYLDLIAYRSLSNKIADDTGIVHESPQVLLISKGKCIFNESHSAILMDDIIEESRVAS